MSGQGWLRGVLGVAGSLVLVSAAAVAASENVTGAATVGGGYTVTMPMVSRDAPVVATATPFATNTTPPLPSAAPTRMATAAPTAIPLPPGISVRKHSSYVNSIGTLHIVGEVVNGLSAAAQYVEITADLYSSSGTLLATDYTFSRVSIVPPGGSSPFDLLVLDPPTGVSRYQVRVTDYVSPPYGGRVAAVGLLGSVTNVYASSIGTLHFVGTVTNSSGKTYKYVQPIVALYGPDGHVVRVDFTFTKPDTLAPGQTGTFDLIVFDGSRFTYTDYSLWVDGD